MALIAKCDFDGGTSLPSGWSSVATVTIGTTNAYSSPNGANYPAGSAQYNPVTYTTNDPANGDVLVQTKFLIVSGNPPNTSVDVRARASGTAYSGINVLFARYRLGTGLQLYRRLIASVTQLSSTIAVTLSLNTWYILFIECSGTSIKVRLQNTTNGQWYYAGAWSSTQGDAISVTDSLVTGAGYWGANFWPESNTSFYIDDIQADTLVNTPPLPSGIPSLPIAGTMLQTDTAMNSSLF